MRWAGIAVLLSLFGGVFLDQERHCKCHGEMPVSAQDVASRIAGLETAIYQAGKRIESFTSGEEKEHISLEETVDGTKEMLWKVEEMEDHDCDAVAAEDREDCGYPGISHHACSVRGCCWDQLPQGQAGPWCFLPESGKEDDPCFDKFKCYTPLGGSGQRCVSWALICDGHRDCDSGFDEDDFVCKERLPAGSIWHSHFEDFGNDYECVRWRYKAVDLAVESVALPFGYGLPTYTVRIDLAYWSGAWSEVKHGTYHFTGKMSAGGKRVFYNPDEGFMFYLWFTGANDDIAIVQPALEGGTRCPEFTLDRRHTECQIDPKVRKDCGYPGITHHVCRDVKNCCYHELNEPGPWCFYSTTSKHQNELATWEHLDRQCKIAVGEREDCGFPGITEHVCSAIRGCCYHELSRAGNWCYKPKQKESERAEWEKLERSCKFNIADRKDCGYPGIPEDSCTSFRGCCYHELDGPGPWCFYHKQTTKESSDDAYGRLDESCKIEAAYRRDCGYPGIPEHECSTVKGCCYHELDGYGPWCYYHK